MRDACRDGINVSMHRRGEIALHSINKAILMRLRRRTSASLLVENCSADNDFNITNFFGTTNASVVQ